MKKLFYVDKLDLHASDSEAIRKLMNTRSTASWELVRVFTDENYLWIFWNRT